MSDIKVLVVQEPGKIDLNFLDLKNAISEKVSAYSNLVVTEETIPGAKKDLADLRKVRTELDDRRKAAKKIWMQPYEEFEKQIKEVISEIDKPITAIDTQLKDFEADRIAKKQARLRELYEENIGEYAAYLPFTAVKKPQWDNKSCKDQDIIYDISEAVVKVSTEIDAIKALGSEIEEKLLNVYKANGNNLAAAIAENTRYAEAKKAAEENLRAEQERKAREEAERQAEAERKAKEESDRKAWEEASRSAIEAVPVRETPKDDFINPPEHSTYIIRLFDKTAFKDVISFMEFNEILFETSHEYAEVM